MTEKKRGRGRPVGTGKGFTEPLGTVRLTPELEARLQRVVKASGLPKAEITRRALAAWLDTWESGSGSSKG